MHASSELKDLNSKDVNRMKLNSNWIGYLVVACLGGLIAVGVYAALSPSTSARSTLFPPSEAVRAQLAGLAENAPADFTAAAEIALPAVVHVESKGQAQRMDNEDVMEFFRFFGPGQEPQMRPRRSSGSGVILSADGFIVTNNHVVEDADEVTITLYDNHKYTAEVIGTDGQTDLALLKIKAPNALPFLKPGSSDQIRVGEWVLAVGNPLNLTSTVTAGIISAKGRSLGIIQDSLGIESFIQTDAAVNPGNSGGALVNTRGELVGINTAIASTTGMFSGYSFAVPVQIMTKVVDDLMNYGEVQRALLGVSIQNVNADLAKQYKLGDLTSGVYIARVNEGSAAGDAGLKEGDIITAVGDVAVQNAAELQEQVGRRRPGDKVAVKFLRDGAEKTTLVTLKSRSGKVVPQKVEVSAAARKLGCELASVPQEAKTRLQLKNGVQVTGLRPGLLRSAGVREGFIILRISDKEVTRPEDVEAILNKRKSAGYTNALLEGIYPDGTTSLYPVQIN